MVPIMGSSFSFKMVTHERDMLRKDVKRISLSREGPVSAGMPVTSSSTSPPFRGNNLTIASPTGGGGGAADLLYGYHHHRTASDTVSPAKGNYQLCK